VARKLRSRKKYVEQAESSSSGLKVAIQWSGVLSAIVLFFSCLSFDLGDWPSPYAFPHNQPPANWCGHVGAFCAYYLMYYLGPGAFLALACIIGYGVLVLLDKSIEQPVLRSLGLFLLTVAISCTFYCLWPHRLFRFPFGSGGVLGVATATFLKDNFAILGTTILMTAMWIVGLLLLADNWVMAAPQALGRSFVTVAALFSPAWASARDSRTLAAIWQRLSTKQKSPTRARRTVGAPVEATNAEAEETPAETTVEGTPAEETMEPVAEAEAAQAAPAQANPSALEQIKALAINRVAAQRTQEQAYVQPSYEDYTLPPLSLLADPEYGYAAVQEKVVQSKAKSLEQLLGEFNVSARVVAAETGPVITMFELELAAGIKVSQVSALSNDMARALGVGAVRVVAPLAGKHTIGVEVPNSEKEKVRLRNMIELAGDRPSKMAIPLFLGKDSSGEALVSDLAKMPHLLIAGTTGSGKSVCINSIVASILLTKRPDEIKVILVDPKMVEMTAFTTIPHLMCPIVTETQMAVQILEWATVKMDERYAVLAEARVKNIAEYNQLGAEEIINRFNPSSPEEEAQIAKRLPHIVIIIDELADLMMTASKEIESFIVRLAQKSRAVGIHLVLATQRPQATVVTGLIKSNMPTRVAFRVAARMDSRIILDQNGAETLLGEGDMLFLKPGSSDLVRAQGTLVDDGEIRRIVKHLKEIAEPQFHPELTQLKKVDAEEMQKDDMFDQAVRIVLETKRGSVSLLQRRLAIGYARASRIIEMMAAAGVLGEYKGSQAREVLITLEEYERLCAQMQADAEASPKAVVEEPGAEHDQDQGQDEDQPEEASSEPTYAHHGEELSASGKEN
jgi:S-DNA-T family DNA segregation ATPase FtsK/SpoIIIE